VYVHIVGLGGFSLLVSVCELCFWLRVRGNDFTMDPTLPLWRFSKYKPLGCARLSRCM